jgi:hypothetical protein
MLGQGLNNRNNCDVVPGRRLRSDGTTEEILGVPMAGAIVVGCLDDRSAGHGGSELNVVMVRVVPAVMRLDGLATMIVIVVVKVDVVMIASGVVVEVEDCARRCERGDEEGNGQRRPRPQSCTYAPHCGCAVPHSAGGRIRRAGTSVQAQRRDRFR